jgi:hypothetical protein
MSESSIPKDRRAVCAAPVFSSLLARRGAASSALGVLLAIALSTGVPGQEPAAAKRSPAETRLLRAIALEEQEADEAAAVAIYEELGASETVPASIRDRARIRHALVLRREGRGDAARALLERVVADDEAGEGSEHVERARALLQDKTDPRLLRAIQVELQTSPWSIGTLIQFGEATVEPLLEEIAIHPFDLQRLEAAGKILTSIGGERAVRWLNEQVDSAQPLVVRALASGINRDWTRLQRGPEMHAFFERLAAHPDARVRMEIVGEASQEDAKQTRPILSALTMAKAIFDPDLDVRRRARSWATSEHVLSNEDAAAFIDWMRPDLPWDMWLDTATRPTSSILLLDSDPEYETLLLAIPRLGAFAESVIRRVWRWSEGLVERISEAILALEDREAASTLATALFETAPTTTFHRQIELVTSGLLPVHAVAYARRGLWAAADLEAVASCLPASDQVADAADLRSVSGSTSAWTLLAARLRGSTTSRDDKRRPAPLIGEEDARAIWFMVLDRFAEAIDRGEVVESNLRDWQEGAQPTLVHSGALAGPSLQRNAVWFLDHAPERTWFSQNHLLDFDLPVIERIIRLPHLEPSSRRSALWVWWQRGGGDPSVIVDACRLGAEIETMLQGESRAALGRSEEWQAWATTALEAVFATRISDDDSEWFAKWVDFAVETNSESFRLAVARAIPSMRLDGGIATALYFRPEGASNGAKAIASALSDRLAADPDRGDSLATPLSVLFDLVPDWSRHTDRIAEGLAARDNALVWWLSLARSFDVEQLTEHVVPLVSDRSLGSSARRDARELLIAADHAPFDDVLLAAYRAEPPPGRAIEFASEIRKRLTPTFVPYLLELMKQGGKVADEARSVLEDLRTYQDETARWERRLAGANLEGATPAEALVAQTLPEKARDVRLAAIRSLGALADPEVLPFLVRLLEDGDEGIRAEARTAIDRIVAARTRAEDDSAEAPTRRRRRSPCADPTRTLRCPVVATDVDTRTHGFPRAVPDISLDVSLCVSKDSVARPVRIRRHRTPEPGRRRADDRAGSRASHCSARLCGRRCDS